MAFIKGRARDFYLHDSQLENIFINEYMPQAPGDFVKVYVYGFMYASFDMEISTAVIAKQLGISVKKVIDAWDYWEEMGAIKKHYIGVDQNKEYTIEFVSLKELMYSSEEENPNTVSLNMEKEEAVFGDDKFRIMFDEIEKTLGRSISSTEIKKIITWISEEKIPPEVIKYGVRYCVEKGKSSFKYIESVILNWSNRGFHTIDDISNYLEEIDQRFYQYRRILQALGFNRNATEKEKEMMDRWFDELGYSMDRILEAVGKTTGIANPNFSYVNKVLENWHLEAKKVGSDVNKNISVSQGQLKDYYTYLRKKSEEESDKRTRNVYKCVPRIQEIDQRMQQLGTMLSKALIAGNEGKFSVDINKERDELEEERAVLLTDNNYELDYTDKKYYCDKCHDTGITDMGEPCSCRGKRMEEAVLWLKSGRGNG